MSWFARCTALAAVALFSLPAIAQESAYTELELGSCAAEPLDPEDPLTSGIWICPGFAGVPVWIAESDLRFFVSYGANGWEEPAGGETLPPFNTINTTLEWRVGEDGQPYATILRFFLESGDGVTLPGQALVVTRVGKGGGNTCHMAYVDALANPNANLLARQLADAMAPMFRCGFDFPRWFGEGGLE